MENSELFVNMNQYVFARYVSAYKHRNETDIVKWEMNCAYGAFQMFRILCPNILTDSQLDNFWSYYRSEFEALINQSEGR